jgi:hypothetical protein
MTPNPTVKFLIEFFFTDITHWLGLVVLVVLALAFFADFGAAIRRRH